MDDRVIARGRVAPWPTLTLPVSGQTVEVRRLAADTMAKLRAQALRELEPERPEPPSQTVAVGPGDERTVPNPGDPAYQDALAAWEARITSLVGKKFTTLVQEYAVITPTDLAAVEAWREAMAAVGVDAGDLTDRQVWMWEIVAVHTDDHHALMGFVLGMSAPQQEAIRAAARTFRGHVEGAGA